AGAFNSNIVKASKYIADRDYSGKNVEFLTIGKKANDILKKTHKIFKNETAIYDDLSFENASAIAEELMQLFVEKKFDKIVIVYNQFVNAATQDVKTEQFLPIVPVEKDENVVLDYIFEPSKEEIV
ncbi:F0F1 ATP synthase subunit gamma, partial [Tamlana crocina]